MKTLSMLLVVALLAAVPAPAFADDGPDVTLQVEDAKVIDVIQMIAEMAKANVIVSPKVKGTITVSFRDTPWRKALETVAETTGNALVEQDFGIFTIVPKAEAQTPRKQAAAKKSHEEILAELEAAQKRLAEAKKGVDEANAKSVHKATDAARERAKRASAALARSGVALDALKEALAKDAAAKAANKQVLQVHVIGDLEKKGLDIRKIAYEVLGKDVTEIGYSNGHLSVRATPAAQMRLTKYLGSLRDWKFVKGGVVTGRVVTTHGETEDKAKIRVRTGVGNPPLVVTGSRDGTYKVVLTSSNESALKARIEKLEQAAKLLDSAGDKAGAARVRAQAAGARKQLAEMRWKYDEAKLAYRNFGATKPDAKLLGAVEGLRKEVGALRRDVRDLTALVRKLLEQGR